MRCCTGPIPNHAQLCDEHVSHNDPTAGFCWDENKNHIKVGSTKHQNYYTPRLRRVGTVERVRNVDVLAKLPHAPNEEQSKNTNKNSNIGLGSLTVCSLLCHFAYPLRKIDPFFSFLRFSSLNVLLVKQWRVVEHLNNLCLIFMRGYFLLLISLINLNKLPSLQCMYHHLRASYSTSSLSCLLSPPQHSQFNFAVWGEG